MKLKKVICIAGKAQHGKDTFAEILANTLKESGQRVLVTHHAALLKFICKEFFNWDGLKDDKGRTLLQQVGTEKIRFQNPNYWVDFLVNVLTLFDGEWDYVIIPDCRFPNEISTYSAAGFDTAYVRVVRPNFDNGLSVEQQNHSSETALDNTTPDYVILNDSDINGFKEKAKDLIIKIS